MLSAVIAAAAGPDGAAPPLPPPHAVSSNVPQREITATEQRFTSHLKTDAVERLLIECD